MKKLILKITAITLFSSITFIACKKDNRTAPVSVNAQSSVAINQSLTQGSWRVGSYIDNSIDKTKNYDGSELHFINTGIVTATDPSNVFTGSWSTNTNGHLQLMLNFANQGAFSDLTRNWTVSEINDTQLKLSDTNNGNADYLTISKNLIK